MERLGVPCGMSLGIFSGRRIRIPEAIAHKSRADKTGDNSHAPRTHLFLEQRLHALGYHELAKMFGYGFGTDHL
jgi:hypothetical protein